MQLIENIVTKIGCIRNYLYYCYLHIIRVYYYLIVNI